MSEEEEIIKEEVQSTNEDNQHDSTSNQETNKTESTDQVNGNKTDDSVGEKPDMEEEVEEPVEMVEIPKTRLEELENAESKFMEDLKRERAEGINYRKRLQKQRDEFAEIASAQILSKVLVAFDDLKRVIDNANSEIPENHMEGINLVHQRIQGIFDQEGVSLIKIDEGKTKYDPTEMEAVVSQPIDGVEPNTVVGVISQGFKKGERVLRPAKVMISKAVAPPKEPTPEPKSDANKEANEDPQEEIKENTKEES